MQINIECFYRIEPGIRFASVNLIINLREIMVVNLEIDAMRQSRYTEIIKNYNVILDKPSKYWITL